MNQMLAYDLDIGESEGTSPPYFYLIKVAEAIKKFWTKPV